MDVPGTAAATPYEELPDGYFGKDYGRIPAGTPITPGLSYADMLALDPGESPPAAKTRGNHLPKPRHVSYDRYWDPEIAKLEDEHLWQKSWLAACREEEIPKVGDRVTFEIRDRSYLIVRASETEIRAYYNSCRHRGRLLCADHKASGDAIRCPYHGWTYNLDGSVAWIPGEADFPAKDRRGMGLSEIRTDSWGGTVFINADPKAPPLDKSLGVLVDFFEDFPLEDRYTSLFLKIKLRANWKTAQEAFLEAYHTTETHWDSLALFNETAAIHDSWQDEHSHVGRLLTPTGVPSGYLADRVPIRQVTEQYTRLFCGVEAAPGRGETVEDARNYIAELKREQLTQTLGTDFSQANNPMVLDFVKFFSFPNFHPWWGEVFPVAYRVLPLGMNTEECLFEIRWLSPIPAGQERPVPATPIDIDFEQRLIDVPEASFLGHILDQDMVQIPIIQAGMHAARPDRAGPILGIDAEKQITHFYEKYDKMLGLKGRGKK